MEQDGDEGKDEVASTGESESLESEVTPSECSEVPGEGVSIAAAVRSAAWEFPLSRQEKMQRLLLLFEHEVQRGGHDARALLRENQDLRKTVHALREELCTLRKEVGSSSSDAARDTPLHEAISFLDEATRKVVDDTSEKASEAFSFIDQAKRKVVDDTQHTVQKFNETWSHLASDLESKTRFPSQFNETWSHLASDFESKTRFPSQATEALQAFQEESAKALDNVLSGARSEHSRLTQLAQAQAQLMQEQAQDFLGPLGWDTHSKASSESHPTAGRSRKRPSLAQEQAEDLTGKAFQAGEAFRASLWSWGQDMLTIGVASRGVSVGQPFGESATNGTVVDSSAASRTAPVDLLTGD